MVCAGLLYILIGSLAIGLATGAGGKATDRTGALHEIAAESWGTAVLVVLAIGFAGYALWRFAVAALGERLETFEDLGWGKRAWYAVRGGFYALLCYATVELLVDSRASSGNEREQTETVLDWPAGRWLVGAFGLGMLAWALGNAYRGISRNFKDDLRTGQMASGEEWGATRAGVVRYLARAMVFALIGVFLIRAAAQYDPKEAIGSTARFRNSSDRPSGRCSSASWPRVSSPTVFSPSSARATARSEQEREGSGRREAAPLVVRS